MFPRIMNTSQAKLVAAVVTVFLLVGDVPATSAFLPYGLKGSKKSAPCISRRMLPGKEGRLGCESLQLASNKLVPFQSLRSISLLPPPSPSGSRQKSMNYPTPPPPNI